MADTSTYPATLDGDLRALVAPATTPSGFEDFMQLVADAVAKIETELGVNPSGASATVAAAVAAVAADLAAHEADTADAHDASAISIVDTAGDFTATDVEGALAELQADHETDAADLAAHIADTTAAHAASAISFTPTGTVAATDVQAAIAEVASESAPLASPALTGVPTAPTAAPGTNTTQIATTAHVKTAVDNSAYIGDPPAGMYVVPNGGTLGTMPVGAGVFAGGCWLFLPVAASVDRIGIEVTTAGAAGDLAGLYLYKRQATGDVFDQVLAAGTVSLASTGFKEITVAATLGAGTYAALVTGDVVTGSPLVRARNNASVLGLYAPEQAAITDQRGGIHPAQFGSPALPLASTLTWWPGTRAHAAIVYLRAA